jgi:hypothetical protein
MISELEIIFGLDPVACELRIARHALILFEQLSGIAALAIFLPVPRLAAEVLAPLSTTTAPAAALSIVDQILKSSRLFASPFGFSRGRAAPSAASDLLVRAAHKRFENGRLRRGLNWERSAADLERARPRALM